MPDTDTRKAALRRASIGGVLVFLGIALLVGAITVGPFMQHWRQAFYALLFSYPLGSRGERMIEQARDAV